MVPRRLIHSYHRGWSLILCLDELGVPIRLGLSCCVSQGSVLGPLFWNTAFDEVFRLPLLGGTITIGFADDMLVVAERDTVDEAEDRANTVLTSVSGCILGLGLELSVEKLRPWCSPGGTVRLGYWRTTQAETYLIFSRELSLMKPRCRHNSVEL